MITIDANTHRLMEMRSELIWLGSNVTGLAAQAVEDTSRDAEAMLENELASEIAAPRREINTRVRRRKARQETFATISGAVWISGRVIPLRRFDARQTKAGVTFRPYVTGGRKLIPGAFGPNIPAIGRGVFKRRGKSRLPIKRLPGLRLTDDPVAKRSLARVQAEVPKMLARNVNARIKPIVQGQAMSGAWRNNLAVSEAMRIRAYGSDAVFSRSSNR